MTTSDRDARDLARTGTGSRSEPYEAGATGDGPRERLPRTAAPTQVAESVRGDHPPSAPPSSPGRDRAPERRADDTARVRGREERRTAARRPAAKKIPASAPPDGLRWHDAPSVPAAIQATLADGLTYAHWLVDRAPEHPALSVHEYRKTIRRLRAVVRLLRPLLGKKAYRSLDTGLRSAVRPTSGLRDARILSGALALVPARAGAEALRAALEAEWEERLARLEAGDEEARVLAASRAPLARLPGELAAALPAEIDGAELRSLARRSYRRTRRAYEKAVATGDDDRIHAARKRVKELRYQLEWLVAISGKRNSKRWKRLAELAQELGEVTDLFVLEDAVRAHAPAAAAAAPSADAAAPGANGAADANGAAGTNGASPHWAAEIEPFAARVRTCALRRWEKLVAGRGELFGEPSADFTRGIAKKLG